ncbi:unnamed protein product [Chondrus crispus]|uniref:Uncharacterized protein n=1 Tax=Chondrus crispus TaxID=2769 RepID=R7QR49_CHOCR|nr:unnamed protein product [Chondrus crispus]CDF40604.1 unnamed protein product [Chondrus crispus]|eukprot:XP_005710898.1 unnamed protein product [Chondrus crispus]
MKQQQARSAALQDLIRVFKEWYESEFERRRAQSGPGEEKRAAAPVLECRILTRPDNIWYNNTSRPIPTYYVGIGREVLFDVWLAVVSGKELPSILCQSLCSCRIGAMCETRGWDHAHAGGDALKQDQLVLYQLPSPQYSRTTRRAT